MPNFVALPVLTPGHATKSVTVTPTRLAVTMDVEAILAGLAVRRKGLILRSAAIEEGVTDDQLDDRLAMDRLVRLYENVYRHPAVPVTTDQRWLAAVLACGDDAVLSGRAGAALHEWPNVRRVRPEVTTPHTDLPRIRGVDIHRAVRLQPHERTVVRGIPVTSRGKTALDLCWLTSLAYAQEVLAQAVITKRLSPLDIVTTLERSCGRGVRGTTKLRAIALSLEELEGLESVLELEGTRAIEVARVPMPIRQFEMTCVDGRVVRIDLAWPDVRVGLDWDGKQWHGTPASKRRTRERHASIEASGWRHFNFGHTHVQDTPNEMRAEVESAIDARRHRLAA